MKYSKNTLVYALWAIFSFIICFTLSNYIAKYTNSFVSAYKLPTMMVVVIIITFFILIFLSLRNKYSGDIVVLNESKKFNNIFIFVVFVLMFYMVYSGMNKMSTTEFRIIGDRIIYDEAIISIKNNRFSKIGLNYLYEGILSIIFSIFGNKEALIIITNYIFNILGTFILCVATNKMFNKIVTIVMLVATVCAKHTRFSLYYARSENLDYLIFSIILLVIAFNISKFKASNSNINEQRLSDAIVIGAIIGFFSYMSIGNLALLIIFISYRMILHQFYRNIGLIIIDVVVSVTSAIGGFILSAFTHSQLKGESFVILIVELMIKFSSDFRINVSMLGPLIEDKFVGVLLVLALFYIIRFIFNKKDTGTILVLPFIYLLVLQSAFKDVEYIHYQLLIYWMMSVFGGVGLLALLEKNQVLTDNAFDSMPWISSVNDSVLSYRDGVDNNSNTLTDVTFVTSINSENEHSKDATINSLDIKTTIVDDVSNDDEATMESVDGIKVDNDAVVTENNSSYTDKIDAKLTVQNMIMEMMHNDSYLNESLLKLTGNQCKSNSLESMTEEYSDEVATLDISTSIENEEEKFEKVEVKETVIEELSEEMDSSILENSKICTKESEVFEEVLDKIALNETKSIKEELQEVEDLAFLEYEAKREVLGAKEADISKHSINKADISSVNADRNMHAENKGAMIKYIPNPLPTPKRHIKRQLAYDYEIDENKLFFDVDIEYNSDYDY